MKLSGTISLTIKGKIPFGSSFRVKKPHHLLLPLSLELELQLPLLLPSPLQLSLLLPLQLRLPLPLPVTNNVHHQCTTSRCSVEWFRI